jgi:hypothetical protein
MKRLNLLWLILSLSVYAQDVDPEVIRNLDFFLKMEVLENEQFEELEASSLDELKEIEENTEQ